MTNGEEESSVDREELMELAMDLGYRLQESGAEIYRVEESINRLFAAYGVQGDVFAVNNCIILTISGDGEAPLTRMRRVPAHDTNLDMVEAYNAVSRKLCAEAPDFAAAKELLRQPRRNTKIYSPLAVLLGAFLSAAAFCMYNQAGVLDGLWAGVCGTAVLLCDLLKGALPVWLCAKVLNPLSLWFVPVLVAPVFGHAHSCLFRGRGGKCIAVSFGVLLGLLPLWRPLALLAVFYILFSTLIKVPDHARRTILSFACWTVSVVLFVRAGSIACSCAGITAIVIHRHLAAQRQKQREDTACAG